MMIDNWGEKKPRHTPRAMMTGLNMIEEEPRGRYAAEGLNDKKNNITFL